MSDTKHEAKTQGPTLPILGQAADPSRITEALRAVVAGGGAAGVIHSSLALFEAGGKAILDESSKRVVRQVAERGANAALAAVSHPLFLPAKAIVENPAAALGRSGVSAARAIGSSGAARVVGKTALRFAGKEVLKSAGRAAGIGLAIDGAFAGIEAIVAVRNGTMDRKEATRHVVTEAATGAVATGAGVLLGAGLVALTGGVAAPVVFAVGALGSIGTKRILSRFTRKTAPTDEAPKAEAPVSVDAPATASGADAPN